MEIVNFGNTPLRVSKIGLGLAALGRPGYINLGHGNDLNHNYAVEAMQDKAFEILDEAYANGIRYFDVARSYGKGEQFLSNWIGKRKQKGDFVVGSKWGYTYTANWEVEADKHEVKDHSIEILEHQWPLSRDLLGEKLAIYHIHSATLDSGVLENKEVLDKLWALKRKGIVVGLSLSGPQQGATLEKALHICRGEELLFQSVQVSWNILEQSATAILQEAFSQGLGIIIKEALANGRLTNRNKSSDFTKKQATLLEMAKKYQITIDALSIAYILQQAWVSTVLSGATTSGQLRSNLQAQHIRLQEEDVALLQNMAEPPSVYWKIRSELPWN